MGWEKKLDRLPTVRHESYFSILRGGLSVEFLQLAGRYIAAFQADNY